MAKIRSFQLPLTPGTHLTCPVANTSSSKALQTGKQVTAELHLPEAKQKDTRVCRHGSAPFPLVSGAFKGLR